MIQTLHAFALSASIAGAAVVKTGAFVAAAAVLPLSVPAAAQSAAAALPAASQGLTLEHRMLLKCSAAFALVAHGQSQGQAEALGYTVSAAEGREYFVQAMAQVMDDTGFSRDEVTEQLTQEAARLSANGGQGLADIMPACTVSLSSFTPPAAAAKAADGVAAKRPTGVP